MVWRSRWPQSYSFNVRMTSSLSYFEVCLSPYEYLPPWAIRMTSRMSSIARIMFQWKHHTLLNTPIFKLGNFHSTVCFIGRTPLHRALIVKIPPDLTCPEQWRSFRRLWRFYSKSNHVRCCLVIIFIGHHITTRPSAPRLLPISPIHNNVSLYNMSTYI